MRWRGRRQSSNIEDQTGQRGFRRLPLGGRRIPVGGKGGMGIGTLIIVGILLYLMGINPLTLLGGGGAVLPGDLPATQASAASGQACERSETHAFSCTVLADTEDTWNAIFAEQGSNYPEPVLVFYAGTGQSGCGAAQSATGPFYCPTDQKIYLDISFFDQLSQSLGASGDFAQAYVIAHEVGHHVQNITGVASAVRKQQSRVSKRDGNALQVRMELQADCYAGIWARSIEQQLEPGDIEEALTAANAIGDDRLQRQARGYAVPDSFTHGTSEQRMRWFQQGFQSGDARSCDSFAASRL